MRKATLLGQAAILAVWAGPALAQTVGGIEVVTVTAERRTEDLQKAPLSVQVVTPAQLAASHISDLSQLQKVSPALVVQDAASNVNPFIRGIGSTMQGSGYYASVATYVDGVYVTRLSSGLFSLDHVDNIQILEGPQGTLYGRNATGGAILVTTHTAEPGDPISMHASAGYGSYDEETASATVSGGINDHLAFSLSASQLRRNGFINNLDPPGAGVSRQDLNSRDYYSIRGEVTYKPVEQLEIVLRGSYFHQNDRAAMGLQPVGLNDFVDNTTLLSERLPINPPTPLNGTQAYYAGLLAAFGVPGGNAEALAANLRFSSRFGATYDNEANGFAAHALTGTDTQGSFNYVTVATGVLKIQYDVGFATLTSNTSYTASGSKSATEIIGADPTSYPTGFAGGSIGFSGNFPAHNVQEDLQLSSNGGMVRWIVGANYLHEIGTTGLTGDLFGFNIPSAFNRWDVRSVAAFAQATIPLNSLLTGLSVTGGGRYTSDSYSLQDLPTFGHFHNRISSSASTYTARLNYQRNDLLVYAGVTSGFKAGTLNATNEASPGVRPETITSYEIGAKWDLDAHLRVNAAAFHYDYQNIQLQVTSSPLAASYLVNGTSARVDGLELGGVAVLSDWANLQLNGLVLDTRYNGDVITPSYGILRTGGKRLAGAPTWSLSLGPDFHIPWVTRGALDLSVTAGINSGYYFDAENLVGTGGAHNEKSFATVDFRLGYTTENGSWRISAWGSNVFNDKYFAGGVVAGGIDKLALAAPPAQFGVTLDYFLN